MAIVSRISTFTVFSRTMRDVNNTQANLFNVQDQISSGYKTREFSGMQGRVEQFTFLEAKVKKAQTYEDNNDIAVARLRTMNVALDRIIDVADEIENLMTLRRNGAMADNINFEQQMNNKLEALTYELNQSFEGKYMFGGTRNNVPPVITEPLPGPLEFGTLDDSYYQGSKENPNLRASDAVTMDATVRADATGFQKVIHASFWALEGHTDNNDDTLVQAMDMLQSGIQDVISIQAGVNIDMTTLEDINSRHESLRLYWTGVTEELSKTDILAASTQLAVDQAVLQASFQAFASVNQLRLVDFL